MERRLSCRRLGAATFLSPTGSGGFLAADWEGRLSRRPVALPPPWLHRSSTTKGRRSGPRRTLSGAAKLDAHRVNRRGRKPIAPAIFAIGFSVQGGGIAQLEEHLLCKQGVVGSNPITSTRFLPDAGPDRSPRPCQVPGPIPPVGRSPAAASGPVLPEHSTEVNGAPCPG